MSESMTIVERTQFGKKPKPIHPIVQAIKQNKKQGRSFLECLIRACNCTLNKKHGYILDNASRMIKPSQLFEYLNVVTTGGVRCVICKEPIEWDILPYHLEDHNLSLDKICNLWERNFTEWDYQNSEFSYLGEKIDIKNLH